MQEICEVSLTRDSLPQVSSIVFDCRVFLLSRPHSFGTQGLKNAPGCLVEYCGMFSVLFAAFNPFNLFNPKMAGFELSDP